MVLVVPNGRLPVFSLGIIGPGIVATGLVGGIVNVLRTFGKLPLSSSLTGAPDSKFNQFCPVLPTYTMVARGNRLRLSLLGTTIIESELCDSDAIWPFRSVLVPPTPSLFIINTRNHATRNRFYTYDPSLTGGIFWHGVSPEPLCSHLETRWC
ncbi:hypothetical protein BDZ94DRAFT_1058612 [Collybia nuda]|uniref:Uncharacterized protein n=1 Tax=Collybia nuda TaxID=64659 RepID=A0A9P6CB58_9AGAR|nr:hypothetical protein BDZ94DRAFT_1058612 [Collybia nuda]